MAKAEKATEKKRRGLSDASRLKLALNDVLSSFETTAKDAAKGSAEVKAAKSLLTELGFETRPSAAIKIQELQTELQSIDITKSDSQTRINEISKEIGKLRRV